MLHLDLNQDYEHQNEQEPQRATGKEWKLSVESVKFVMRAKLYPSEHICYSFSGFAQFNKVLQNFQPWTTLDF